MSEDIVSPESALDRVRRWEDLGGIWRVLNRRADGHLTVSLCRCDGGEEVDRLSSADPGLRHYVGDREASDD